MTDVAVAGSNNTTVIDDKDTVNKTVNKTVNVTKSDNTQLESDVKIIQTDLAKLQTSMNRHTAALTRINKKINKLVSKLIPEENIEEENDNDSV